MKKSKKEDEMQKQILLILYCIIKLLYCITKRYDLQMLEDPPRTVEYVKCCYSEALAKVHPL